MSCRKAINCIRPRKKEGRREQAPLYGRLSRLAAFPAKPQILVGSLGSRGRAAVCPPACPPRNRINPVMVHGIGLQGATVLTVENRQEKTKENASSPFHFFSGLVLHGMNFNALEFIVKTFRFYHVWQVTVFPSRVGIFHTIFERILLI